MKTKNIKFTIWDAKTAIIILTNHHDRMVENFSNCEGNLKFYGDEAIKHVKDILDKLHNKFPPNILLSSIED